ncbi:nitroreductase family deazaflavin-dependent oxidoreductase [Nocardia yamanashiensis]|uniref:nitroreductase family deazaflavin-dependent oxidoreductase n=1 Tax=Nocardia yamanashiensis TaxID=209247 RepID=UPI000A4CB6A2|nr:nitroreductase family deazaflavin-dependent oxidoreductase [Nocardia yamanashiensis]
MVGMADTARQELHRGVIEEFRANGGKVGGQFASMNLLLLTTTGARTGKSRTWPLAYLRDGERLVVFGANGGRPNRPGWYHNLVADPAASVEVGDENWAVTAEVANGTERERLWAGVVRMAPFVADFQAKVPWEIPIVVLSRAE